MSDLEIELKRTTVLLANDNGKNKDKQWIQELCKMMLSLCRQKERVECDNCGTVSRSTLFYSAAMVENTSDQSGKMYRLARF